MEDRTYSLEEILLRRDRASCARNLVMECMQIEAVEDGAMMTRFHNFYLQISFSELHPLAVFCFARPISALDEEDRYKLKCLNLKSIYGAHAVNEDGNCYIYRAAFWLEGELNKSRLFEILDRFSEEANKGFLTITAI